MAKSKSGGTRSYLRGRIASDVYSIGRDSNGKKQQVVRSLAEQVANPQTIAQMRGRMIMSTVMQAVSGLKSIIDHSFDGIPTGQPSISEFIRQNYALIKADVAAHPSSGNKFGLNAYQEKGQRPGAYLISNGSAIFPAAYSTAAYIQAGGSVTLSADAHTMGDLRATLGMSDDDYITTVWISDEKKALFYRLSLNPAIANTTEIDATVVKNVFILDNPFNLGIDFDFVSNEVQILVSGGYADSCGYIFTKKTENGFIHSTSVMKTQNALTNTADDALPTYPIGEERFLNGGEI